MENYRRMAAVLGTDAEKMVLSYQTHTTNVRKVTEEDAGKGIVKERDYRDVDGLITDIPGITLVTFCHCILWIRSTGLSDCPILAGGARCIAWEKPHWRP